MLIGRDDMVKLSDFGTAQELHETMMMLTQTPELTLRWAAPERLKGATILTAAADVYSAGMVLLEMVTGQVPFPSLTVFQLSREVSNCDLP